MQTRQYYACHEAISQLRKTFQFCSQLVFKNRQNINLANHQISENKQGKLLETSLKLAPNLYLIAIKCI